MINKNIMNKIFQGTECSKPVLSGGLSRCLCYRWDGLGYKRYWAYKFEPDDSLKTDLKLRKVDNGKMWHWTKGKTRLIEASKSNINRGTTLLHIYVVLSAMTTEISVFWTARVHGLQTMSQMTVTMRFTLSHTSIIIFTGNKSVLGMLFKNQIYKTCRPQ